MKVGVLTGGGDCPGLNPVIRAIVRKGIDKYKYEMIGIRHGWKGLLEMDYGPLDLRSVSGILPRGGTILGTSRTNPDKVEGGASFLHPYKDMMYDWSVDREPGLRDPQPGSLAFRRRFGTLR